ncbi:hypothetical protein MnTg02_01522 [bacterium MnTg02]|nr:hypothetical protein MnTg02_01522 [bacterium MnTg02]
MAFGIGKSKKANEKQATEMATKEQDPSSETTDQVKGEEQKIQPVITQAGSEKPGNARQLPPHMSQVLQSKLLAANFGNIITVLMQSPGHKKLTLEDLNWLVLPALLNNQFIVAEGRRKDSGYTIPVGLALWAKVSEDVDKILTANLNDPIKMTNKDWRSGEIFWLIELIGDKRFIRSMMDNLNKNVFKGQPVKFRTMDENDNKVIKTLRSPESKPSDEKPSENGSGEASPSES